MLLHRLRLHDRQALIEQQRLALQYRNHGLRIAARPHDQRHDRAVVLTKGSVEVGPRFFAQRPHLGVLRDGDDLAKRSVRSTEPQPFAYGVITGPEPPCSGLVHDDDQRRRFVILIPEVAPLNHRDAHRFEIARTDDGNIDRRRIIRRCAGTLYIQRVHVDRHAEWQVAGKRDVLDAGDGPGPFAQLGEQVLRTGLVIAG